MNYADPSTERFVFTSSIASEAWHPQKDPKAHEWWYFDALSDEGSEGVSIIFLDNFVYSPRFQESLNGSKGLISQGRLPAVSFTYFSGGKTVYHAKSEFTADGFFAGDSQVKCRIGESGFRFESASYGSGYLVSVDLPLPRDRRLRANFEWLSIEADLHPTAPPTDSPHTWNMAAPRCDVSGRITVEDHRGRTRDSLSFRGTGYHDHNIDNEWLARSVKEWHWGRAHFADSTAVFCRFDELSSDHPFCKLLIYREGGLKITEAEYREIDHARDIHGIRYPSHFYLTTNDGTQFEVAAVKLVDSSFYHLRCLTTVNMIADGREHSAHGFTEYIAPRALRSRWLNWLSDFRTGRDGKAARL